MFQRATLCAALLLGLSSATFAETMQRPSGAIVPSAAIMCPNGVTNADGSQQVIPCGSSGTPIVVSGGGGSSGSTQTQGTAPTGNLTPSNAIDTPANASPTSCSATPGTTAASFLTASRLHNKLKLKVEGAGAVCFNNLGGTATIGSADTFCLKGASSANAGDGGSYVTPIGQSDNLAWSAVAATASSLVYCSWQ